MHFYNEETARGNMLITKHEIIENKISGNISRELEKAETREVREAYDASPTFQTLYYTTFNDYQQLSGLTSQYFVNFKQN